MKRFVVAVTGVALLIAAAPLVSLAFFADGAEPSHVGQPYALRFEQAAPRTGVALEMGYSEADRCATEGSFAFIG